jgi:hypothetical protein
MHFYSTFNEVDGLLQTIGVLVAVIENVSAKPDALDPVSSAAHDVVHEVDGVQHRLQSLRMNCRILI